MTWELAAVLLVLAAMSVGAFYVDRLERRQVGPASDRGIGLSVGGSWSWQDDDRGAA